MVGVVLLAAAPAALLVLALALVVQLLRPTKPQLRLASFPHPAWLYAQVPFTLGKRASIQAVPLIQVELTRPAPLDLRRLVGFMRLAHFGDASTAAAGVPLSYPIVEAFRLIIQAMVLPAFPVSVLGSVLARNTTTLTRALTPDDKLTYRVSIDPSGWRSTVKGDTEVDVVSEAFAENGGAPVWRSVTTAIILNPKRTKGGGGKPAQQAGAEASPWDTVVDTWRVGAHVGRAYGSLNGDLNPIHLHALTAQLFGFKRPIAHALFLVARAEASLRTKHGVAPAYPATLATEFKRPTLLPATLRVAVSSKSAAAKGPLSFALLTEDGSKEVLTGTLS